jgi:hypothetical protein
MHELKNRLTRINSMLSENGFIDIDEPEDGVIEKTKGEKEIKIYLNNDGTIDFIIYFSYSGYMKSNNFTNINWLSEMIKKSIFE